MLQEKGVPSAGAGGLEVGQELQQRLAPAGVWGQAGLPPACTGPDDGQAQACPSRARTCTLGRQNQDGGSSLLVLSSWNRMCRKKSPV